MGAEEEVAPSLEERSIESSDGRPGEVLSEGGPGLGGKFGAVGGIRKDTKKSVIEFVLIIWRDENDAGVGDRRRSF